MLNLNCPGLRPPRIRWLIRVLMITVTLLRLMVSPVLACNPVPPLAAALDALLPRAALSEADLAKVKDLRAQIKTLVATGKTREARETEEQAMLLLGYKKDWLKCGEGTFQWTKL
jgi:hypothetical protein